MEVAGLVLGVVGTLPMIVKVVEGYQIIIEITRVKRYMATLGQDIETERIILNNTYERLLDGIVPAWELDDLQDVDRSTAKWQKYDDQIRSRLRESYQDFHLRVKAIAEAVEDLKEKLAVTSSGEVQFKNWLSIVSELSSEIRVRTRFTLKKKDYTGTLSKIHENNILLSRLVDHSSAFEPTRRANSQAKLARKVRTLAQCLFSAICKVVCCRCAHTHRLGLHLLQRPGENKDSHDGCASFDMIFGTSHELQKNSPIWNGLIARWKEDECNSLEKRTSLGLCRSVDLLSLKDKDPPGQKGKSTLEASFGALWSKLNRSPSPSKRRAKVAFMISAATASTDEVSIAKLGDNRMMESTPLSHITDLCADIQRVDVMAKQPVGFIPCDENPKRFDLYHHDSMPSSSNTASLTLREALIGKDGLMEFELIERLNIALTLSFSVLQLCNTPWLGKIISLDDIVFLRAADDPRCYTQKLDFPAPFLVRQSPTVRHMGKSLRPVNFALLSLGVLLTHIIMGHPVEAIDLNEDMPKELLLSRKKLADDKVATCDDASENYVGAVQWCFKNCFTFETLEDQELSRNFHDAVIARLERDLRSIDCLRTK